MICLIRKVCAFLLVASTYSVGSAAAETRQLRLVGEGGQRDCVAGDRLADPADTMASTLNVASGIPLDQTTAVHGEVTGKQKGTCGELHAFGAVQPAGRSPAVFSALDTEAQQWLLHDPEAQEDLQALRAHLRDAMDPLRAPGAPDRRTKGIQDTVLQIHYPSGAPSFYYRSSVPEGKTVRVAIIVEAEAPGFVSMELTACPARERFRTLGDLKALSAGKALAAGSGKVRRFRLMPLGKPFECGAGDLSYNISVAAKEGDEANVKAHTIRVRPIYHLATTFSWGFDMWKQQSFAVESAKIAGTRDPLGPSFYVGFTWFPTGVDYEDMKSVNRWLNPVVLFDLSAPKDNFAAGLAFTRTGGLSVVAAVSLHKMTALDKGFTDAAPFTGEGAIPTRPVWNRDSIGLFFGVAADDKVFTALKGVWGTRPQ